MKPRPARAHTNASAARSGAKATLAGRGKAPASGSGEVRIIGGLWKRSKLPVLPMPGLRPTPDRVRETLFNWLGQDLTDLRCVDAFAGTGALGFEAASRGATDVLLIEQDAQLVRQLEAHKARLKADALRIQRGDALGALKSLPRKSVDLIFLDPPFGSALFNEAISAAALALVDRGAIYLEAPATWTNDQLRPFGLHVLKQGQAGAVHFHLLQLIQGSPT